MENKTPLTDRLSWEMTSPEVAELQRACRVAEKRLAIAVKELRGEAKSVCGECWSGQRARDALAEIEACKP